MNDATFNILKNGLLDDARHDVPWDRSDRIKLARIIELLRDDLRQSRCELVGQQMLNEELHERLTVVMQQPKFQLRIV